MKHIRIKEKDIYIVRDHHQVLEAWEKVSPCNVFSLDYHTDTKPAFSTYAYWKADDELKKGKITDLPARKKDLIQEKLEGYQNNQLSIQTINDNLRHDEHIDFSVRTGITEKVFVCAQNSNNGSSNPRVFQCHDNTGYRDQPIIEYSPPRKTGIGDPILSVAVDEAESLQEDFFDQYILDIDCDYFNTVQSLIPEKLDIFNNLVSHAEIITIAKEPECVKICREKNSGLTADIIRDRLLELIKQAQDAV